MQSTQNKLIEILSKHQGQYVSGQKLSEALNISRSAIWKHMKNLAQAGYQIDAKSRVGYRIISGPNQLNEYTLKWGLKTSWLGKTLIHKPTTISTQSDAHQLARNNAKHGTIIIADQQTGGVGRRKRPWHSAEEKGIWMSMILRPDLLPYQAPQLTLLTATVLADVIQRLTDLKPKIKWPNDILINHKKAAGILTEMQAEQDEIDYVIIGIGLNINQQRNDLPTDLQEIATSIAIETNQEWSLVLFVQEILQTFEDQYHKYVTNGFDKIKDQWERYGYKIGEKVWIKQTDQYEQATFLGIAEDGALLIENTPGDIHKVYSAEIDWLKED